MCLDDGLQTIQDLLCIIYSLLAGDHDIEVAGLFQLDTQRFQAVIIAADKYDMPKLLHQMDRFLSVRAQNDHVTCSGMWSKATEAIGWMKAVGNISLPGFRLAAEAYIASTATVLELKTAAEVIPRSSSLRIIIALQSQLQLSTRHRPPQQIWHELCH